MDQNFNVPRNIVRNPRVGGNMINKAIEKECNFTTQRLLVNTWKQTESIELEKSFIKKVIKILSPNITKALPDDWQNINTLDKAESWINQRKEESHFITIELLATSELIGFIFLYESSKENNYYNLRFGYLLAEEVWGEGLGTELIAGLVKCCESKGNIKSISGGVEKNNIASIKVLEKNRFSISKKEKSTKEMIFYEYELDI